ncbi:MAG: sugar ABC transporter substrate-binding protein [Myxococcales bacterium]|nr:sugar ABC transporter substrate-binding protein [Myxococcales bacterium]
MKGRMLVLLFLTALWAAGCFGTGAVSPDSAAVKPGNADAQIDTNEFVIGPGDMLDINVWKNPEFSRQVPVRPDGRITLPLVGDMPAAGKSTDQLKKELKEAFSRYLNEPTVTVIVTQVNSYRIYVQGQVAHPGIYPITGRTTVVQAIALAGGFTEFAARGRLLILRQTAKGSQRIAVDYDRIVGGKDNDVPLRPGDTLVVP